MPSNAFGRHAYADMPPPRHRPAPATPAGDARRHGVRHATCGRVTVPPDERGTVGLQPEWLSTMTVATVVVTAVVMAAVMVSMPAEAKAKTRPEEEAVAVRIGIVVVAFAPNAPTMAMAMMPPATAHPHHVLQSRVCSGGPFQAVGADGGWCSLDRSRQRAERERSGRANKPMLERHACLLAGA